MRLTATTSPIENLAGLDNAVLLIAEGGYDCLDLSLLTISSSTSTLLERNSEGLTVLSST